VTLAGDRLTLRELTGADLPHLLRVYNAPRTLPHAPHPPITSARARQILRQAQAAARSHPRTDYTLAITLTATDAVIGLAALRTGDPAPAGPAAQYGVAITPDHWWHGHGSQARNLLQDYAVRTLGAHRVLGAGNTLILLGAAALPADRAISDPLYHDGTRADAPARPCNPAAP